MTKKTRGFTNEKKGKETKPKSTPYESNENLRRGVCRDKRKVFFSFSQHLMTFSKSSWLRVKIIE